MSQFFEIFILNERSENKDVIAKLGERSGVKKIPISAYYSQDKKMIECGYKPIDNTLRKMSTKRFINQI